MHFEWMQEAAYKAVAIIHERAWPGSGSESI